MAIANDIAYVEKTMPKVLDQVYAKESLTQMLLGKSTVKFDFIDAKVVKIFRLESTGMQTYQRGGHGQTNKRGAVATTTETFELKQERYSEIPLDELDNLDDGGTVLAHLGTEQIRVHMVPETDAYRFSKLAGYTNTFFGNRKEGVIAENTIISELNEAFRWMSEHKVPNKDQIIFVSPDVMLKIRSTDELYKKLSQSEYRDDVTFAIEKYEGRQIVEVPSDEFFTDIVTGDGYYPSATSKAINFMVVDARACSPIVKLQKSKIYNSDGENGTYIGYQGYLFTNLIYHDIFVPDNKKVGIYAHVSNEKAKSSTLSVFAVKGGRGNTKITSYVTNPNGILVDKIQLVKSASVPVIGSVAGGEDITLDKDFTADPSNNIFTAVTDGKVVAVSKNFGGTLPKGA